MRMGQATKPRRGEKVTRADAKGKPKKAAAASVVGKLSPDIISTYFAPELLDRANESLEKYAHDLMTYEDSIRLIEVQGEARIESDGIIETRDEPPLPPPVPIYNSKYWVNQLEEVITDTSQHFQAKNGGWKVHAKAAKFERLMEERYGRFRPFVKNHPEIEQFVRSIQRKYATGYFSPFRQGKPPIPKSTAVIILFMMQRGNMRWEVTVLAVLFFLVGLQPWALVVLVAGGHTFLERKKKRPVGSMKKYIPTVEPYYPSISDESTTDSTSDSMKQKNEILLRPVGKEIEKLEKIDTSEFDVILLGYGPASLYTAALLSRAGRRVLVLSSKIDASGCYVIEGGTSPKMKQFQSVPFDVESSNISKISRQQTLLAPALSTTTDYQGGIRFAQVGTEADGHAFEVLSVPGMGIEKGDNNVPFVLRGDGKTSLMEDAAMFLGDGFPGDSGEIGDSSTGLYIATCEAINAHSNSFYMSKILSKGASSFNNNSTFQDSAIRYASSFLGKGFPLNAHARSLMAAIGMRSENIKPSMTSMGAHVTNISSAMSGEGMHYPIGGPRALCHALATVVEQSGGRVVTHVPIASLIFEEDKPTSPTKKEGEETPAPRCIGIQLADNRSIKFDMTKRTNSTVSPVVISMHGFITTFIRLLPEDVRVKHKVPLGLPALSERRPVFKFLFALDGSANSLEVTGADFYRVPGAALAQDEVDPVTGQVKLGEIGWVDDTSEEGEISVDDINNIPTEDPQTSETTSGGRSKRDHSAAVTSKPSKRKKVKFETGVSWIQISFPSAKDPSFEYRHGNITTCVVTIEADDDFVTLFDTKPKLYSIHKDPNDSSGNCQRLMERVKRDLLNIYPQLDGKILHAQLIGPIHRGLSHNPERYAAKGVRPETPYPGLFVGGSDLTVGESFAGSIVGGWLTANAIMGYSAIDYLFLRKNITSDISMYLEKPDLTDEEDVAVPYLIPKRPDEGETPLRKE